MIYSREYQSAGREDTRPIPIPSDLINIGLQGHTLIVFCASVEPRSQRWIRGCQISQVQRLPFNVQTSNALVTATEIVKLRIPTLLQFPQYQADYDLRIDFYPWFLDLYVEIWEYTGSESDTTTEALVAIASDVRDIYEAITSP